MNTPPQDGGYDGFEALGFNELYQSPGT